MTNLTSEVEGLAPFDLTVAICTHNRGRVLIESVEKIIDAARGKNWVRIVIVNNASTDETDEAITLLEALGQGAGVSVSGVVEDRLGLSVARNRALNECSTSAIAFIDDDAFMDSAWFDLVKAEFQTCMDTVACGGPVVPVYSAPKPQWLDERLLWAYSIGGLGCNDREYEFPEHPLGVNMVFRKSATKGYKFNENLGRKGENLVSWEESEYFKTIMEAGGRVKYLSGAEVKHIIPEERLSKSWLLKRHVAEGRSVALASAEHGNGSVSDLEILKSGIAGCFFFCLSKLLGSGKIAVLCKMKAGFYFGNCVELLLGSEVN